MTPAWIGVIGAVIGAVISGVFALFVWRRTKKTQRDLFEEEWRRRLDQEEAQRKAEEAQEQDRQQKEEETDESRYLEWVTREHRFLPITGLRTRSPVEVELEQVYVSLTADPRVLEKMGGEGALQERHRSSGRPSIQKAEEHRDVTVAEALKLIDGNRVAGLVILGGPGTGKTTVLKYLALTYACERYTERLDQPQARFPLFVTLRNIASDRRAQSLADYMAEICRSAGCKVSADFFDKKLREGECIILLDGLDEVADETQRQQVADWIQRQCNGYSKNPFMVTCRIAGFREEYLPPRFLRLDIQNFNDDDIAQFARNWCLAVETMLVDDPGEARRRGEQAGADLIQAIQASEQVKGLAVNPLMLSIIALVHRYRAHLPERRVDLYAECVEVLLGHWDKAKDLQVSIIPQRSLQVLQPLALWLHEHKQGEKGERVADRAEIEKEMAPYLAGIGMEAGAFLDSIQERSGLLVERELDIFGFQHQTFQEYLAAQEIAQKRRTDLLISHFGDDYWREVTLLYAGIQDTSELIQGVFSLPEDKVKEHWQFLFQILGEALSVDEATR